MFHTPLQFLGFFFLAIGCLKVVQAAIAYFNCKRR